MKRTFTILAAAAAIGAATPAFADTLTIKHDDLNLATAAGQQALDRRIDVAVREFCGIDQQATGSRIASREARACYTDMKAQAKAKFAALVEERQLGG